jgi:transglutaminase-like putative cysteine protease
MATKKDPEKGGGGRLVLLTSLAALAFFSALALGRVFRGGGTGLHLGLAALAATLLAGAMGRRHILLATVLSLAGLVVAIGVLVFPETTRFWLPTLSTVRGAWRSLQEVDRAAATEVAPALPLPPLVLAALAATWTSAFASHALAARARSPFLALLPPAALLAFSNLILDDRGAPLLVLAFMAAALGILFADGSWRVGQWGPVTYWQGRATLWPGAGAGLRSARRVGLVCLGVAVFTPWLLPGYHVAGLVNSKLQTGGVSVSIDPILDVRPEILRVPATPLFTVRASQPAYWRLLSYDLFDGQAWRPSNEAATGGVVLNSGPLPQAPPSTPQDISQQYLFQQLRTVYLPAAAEPISIDVPEGGVRYDKAQSILVTPSGIDAGYHYSVVSRSPAPSSADLDAVASLAPGLSDQKYTRLQLPADLSQQFAGIAHLLTDAQPTPYRRIIAIQDYLRGFTYTLRAPSAPDGNQLLYFLTRSKAGYCVQFASSMALLLRELGIPARVAQGYVTGSFDPKADLYRVTTADAHTWVEVLFPGYGWIPFEPTPTRSNPATQSYATPPPLPNPAQGPSCKNLISVVHGATYEGTSCDSDGKRNTRPKGVQPKSQRILPTPAPTLPPTTVPAAPGGSGKRVAIVLLPLLLLVATAAIPLTKSARRRLLLKRAAGRPRQMVLASYAVLVADAGDIGLGRRAHETLWEYRARLRSKVDGLDAELTRLMGLTGRAAYSERAISPAQASSAAAAAGTIARSLRRSVGRLTRILGWFKLPRRRGFDRAAS